MNTLYYGDNLEVLQRHIRDESVDLIYLDPPFNSNASYNVLFAQNGIRVERGRGYMPARPRRALPIGVLPVDAIFSPVRRVNWSVGNARVGHNTNYDKLVLQITTDGTVLETALQSAVDLLVRH